MIADAILLLGYFLTLMLLANRESLAALCIFAASFLIANHANQFAPWAYHAIHIALYGGLIIAAQSVAVKRITLLMVVFQYIMAWDAALFSNVETVLYSSYPTAVFVLNVLIILTIGKTGSKDDTFYRTDSCAPADWLFHLRPMAAHKKRMPKG